MQTTINDVRQVAELLRLALPLMSKRGVPMTPRNYAVWFEHLSGTNQALSEHIEDLIARNIPFDEACMDKLYGQFIEGIELRLIDEAREAFKALLASTMATFSDADSGFSHFDEVLQRTVDDLDQDQSTASLRDIVDQLKSETRSIQAHGNRMREQLEESQSEVERLRSELDEVRRQATTDALTGLCNRSQFDRQIEVFKTKAEQKGTPLGLLLVDIDKFKLVNDTHGHLVGDKVISFVATTLVDSVKGKDLAARFGGEEFAVLLPETDPNGIKAVAETIRAAVERSRLVKSGTREPIGQVTVSIGASSNMPGEPTAGFIDRADNALYFSKQNGRNRVTYKAPAPGLADTGS